MRQQASQVVGTEDSAQRAGHAQGGPSPARKLIRVVGAAIARDGCVLCALRGPGRTLDGCWEFPGGKIEPGETPQQALVRELHEELGCTIEVDERVCTTRHAYDFGTVELTSFICRLAPGSPEPVRTEHRELRWVAPADMPALAWAPADDEHVRRISRMRL